MVKYEQHFLMDKKIIEEIAIAAQISSEDVIFEIGPGKGNLTWQILERKPKELVSVELDEEMSEYLNNIKRKFKNFSFIVGTGLEEINNFEFNKLVANIPYTITEPLYTKILEKRVPFCLLLQGAHFTRHLMEKKSRWDFYVNAFYNVEIIKKIPGNKFRPKAGTMSTLVRLTLKDNRTKEEEFYVNLFDKRDRVAKNAVLFALVDSYGLTKKQAQEKIKSIEFPNKKLELLSSEEFVKIAFELRLN